MSERLNQIIAAFEKGVPAFGCIQSADVETAVALSTSDYDGVMFEMEHRAWDVKGLKDTLQYMLDRRQIAQSGSIAPRCTPLVRVPANGGEMNQWLAKQGLDVGVYGIVWPHVSTVEQAYNAVAACRYPRMNDKPMYEPVGQRGDGPTQAARYWGITAQEYYRKADVWPLDPKGEVLVILMIEDVAGIENLDDMLRTVPGIGAILIGEGDLSQELGYPRQYTHDVVLAAMDRIVQTCKKYNVPVGHPHVDEGNVERVLAQGYSLLMVAPERSYKGLQKGREVAGRQSA